MRIDHLEPVDYPVVLSEPNGVHRRQGRVLVDAPVAGPVTELALLHVRALVVARVGRMGQQLAASVVEADVHPASRAALRPEGGRLVRCRTVHLRAVDERGDLVHLLAGPQPTARTNGRPDKVETALLPVRVERVIWRHQNGETLRVRVALNGTALDHGAGFWFVTTKRSQVVEVISGGGDDH